ncbi:like-Sm ribonucleoprotein [Neoconidiobolus thromboides FSU 785]|nr:like-Sm ribonucleoprotein [Neoconidiobolus thromboides FSU 785]
MGGNQAPELKRYMDKRLMVHMNAKRKVSGILRGYDPFMNIVLDEASELLDNNSYEPIGTVVIRGNSIVLLETQERVL